LFKAEASSFTEKFRYASVTLAFVDEFFNFTYKVCFDAYAFEFGFLNHFFTRYCLNIKAEVPYLYLKFAVKMLEQLGNNL